MLLVNMLACKWADLVLGVVEHAIISAAMFRCVYISIGYSNSVKRGWAVDWDVGVRKCTEQQIMTSASICWAPWGGDTFNLPPVSRYNNLPLPIVLVTSAFGWLKDECSTSRMGTEQTSRRPLDTYTSTAAQMARDTLLWRLQTFCNASNPSVKWT